MAVNPKVNNSLQILTRTIYRNPKPPRNKRIKRVKETGTTHITNILIDVGMQIIKTKQLDYITAQRQE